MIDEQQRAALIRHGYDPDLRPRGISGGPERVEGAKFVAPERQWPGYPWLRNHVCELDGIEIDGHEMSDLDAIGPGSQCLHCPYITRRTSLTLAATVPFEIVRCSPQHRRVVGEVSEPSVVVPT